MAMARRRNPGDRQALRRRNTTVEQHLRLVRPIAAHYAAHSSEARDDLEQVGVLGLITAAERYDHRLKVPFEAFARQHIRGAILHYLRDTAPMVRLPRRLQERRLQLARLQEDGQSRQGCNPQAEELRRRMGLSHGQWQRLQQSPPLAKRRWLDQDTLEQLPEPLPEPGSRAPEAIRAMAELHPRQRSVLRDVLLKGRSLREVARRQGSSAATVHRLLHAGLAALRIRLSRPADAPAC